VNRMELEVFSEASNHAVVRAAGRKFPGSLVQGDSLSILCSLSRRISERLVSLGVVDDRLLSDAQELQEGLLDRVLHYQLVLEKHGIGLPYAGRFTTEDFVVLLPED
jgi:hypothetical protein